MQPPEPLVLRSVLVTAERCIYASACGMYELHLLADKRAVPFRRTKQRLVHMPDLVLEFAGFSDDEPPAFLPWCVEQPHMTIELELDATTYAAHADKTHSYCCRRDGTGGWQGIMDDWMHDASTQAAARRLNVPEAMLTYRPMLKLAL
jgi:hypothetical protein